ncbi:MAG: 30S ribosomal protein S17e [Nanopusillaceae archaeon]|jgi:small subunit ribosomal protein S17e
MGRILHGKFRREAQKILEKYGDLFTTDYRKNIKILEAITVLPSKRLRNMLAGYITRQIKKLQSS